MEREKIIELFKKHEDEYLKFDRIPLDEKFSESPDLCAFKLISNLLLKDEHRNKDIIRGAEHDEIYLMELQELKWIDWSDNITRIENEIIYLIRCGVRYDSGFDVLKMFV
jgi:hypothetical protein